jgi:hypothetical protein
MTATNDILTLAEAKSYIRVNTATTDKDTLLASMITGISTRMDYKFGPVVFSTITAELHDGGSSSRGGFSRIKLNYSPVSTITQVVEYNGTTAGTLTAQSNTSQPDNSYVFNAVNGNLRRRNSNADGRFPVGRNNILVSYVAGRFAAGTITDERFKIACGLTLENVWRNQQPSLGSVNEFDVPQINWPKFVFPNAVIELLANEVRQGAGF